MGGFERTLLSSFITVWLFSNLNIGEGRRIRRPYDDGSNTPPSIRLMYYLKADSFKYEISDYAIQSKSFFETDWMTRNGSDYIIDPNGIQGVLFECRAVYPVKWTFPHPEQLTETQPSYTFRVLNFRESDFFQETENPSNKMFVSYIRMNTGLLNFFVANFTCQSETSAGLGLSSSFYLYLQTANAIEKQGETVKVFMDKNDKSADVILPCRTSTPNAYVKLFKNIVFTDTFSSKGGGVNSNWLKIDYEYRLGLGSHINFDPKIGFIFHAKNLRIYGYDIPAVYKCQVNGTDNDSEFVLINVTSVETVTVSHFQFRYKVPSESYLHMNILAAGYGTFRCCSGPGQVAPVMYVSTCSSFTGCQLTKESANRIFMTLQTNHTTRALTNSIYTKRKTTPKDCSEMYVIDGPQVVFCTGSNIDVSVIFLAYFNLKMYGVLKSEKKDPSMHAMTYESPQKPDVTKQILILLGRPGSGNSKKLMTKLVSGKRVIPYVGQLYKGGDMTTLISRDPLRSIVDTGGARQPLVLEEIADKVYEGESFHFMCFFLSYFYSHGGHLRIIWKNGTKSILHAEDRDVSVKFSNYFGVPRDGPLTTVFSKEMVASLEIKSVDCFVPIWNSTEWDQRTINISVSASYTPKFIGDEEETLYCVLNEQVCEINCELSEGHPAPLVEIRKDGKKLDTHSQLRVSPVTTSEGVKGARIALPSISHDLHGVYQCTAENFKGTAVRVVRVIVTEKSNNHWVVALLYTGLIALLIVAPLVVWHYFQRKKVQELQSRLQL